MQVVAVDLRGLAHSLLDGSHGEPECRVLVPDQSLLLNIK
jgi:hypothetical protein